MIGISKLYYGGDEANDDLRYHRHKSADGQRPVNPNPKPIVVWNCTQRCNLKCAHCYACSADVEYTGEMTDDQARAMIDDLAAFKAPVLLFSGGEPLMRPGVMDLAIYAKKAGLRTVFSTNGTLITRDVARQMAAAEVSYAGISLDGTQTVNDKFRGVAGAFEQALGGIRACLAEGVKVGLRLTMNARNVAEIGPVFDLIEREGIPRVCFYHLVSTGRGRGMGDDTLTHAQTRAAIDLITDRTADMLRRGKKVQVLTVDNHADGPYLYLRMKREGHPLTDQAYELLMQNGGNSTGSGIACVSWNGDVMPDQFWRQHVLGNVKTRKFSEIWAAGGHEFLNKLRNRRQYLNCRCQHCRWVDVCNGNFRARAEANGDMWGEDPACYLTDEEIREE